MVRFVLVLCGVRFDFGRLRLVLFDVLCFVTCWYDVGFGVGLEVVLGFDGWWFVGLCCCCLWWCWACSMIDYSLHAVSWWVICIDLLC